MAQFPLLGCTDPYCMTYTIFGGLILLGGLMKCFGWFDCYQMKYASRTTEERKEQEDQKVESAEDVRGKQQPSDKFLSAFLSEYFDFAAFLSKESNPTDEAVDVFCSQVVSTLSGLYATRGFTFFPTMLPGGGEEHSRETYEVMQECIDKFVDVRQDFRRGYFVPNHWSTYKQDCTEEGKQVQPLNEENLMYMLQVLREARKTVETAYKELKKAERQFRIRRTVFCSILQHEARIHTLVAPPPVVQSTTTTTESKMGAHLQQDGPSTAGDGRRMQSITTAIAGMQEFEEQVGSALEALALGQQDSNNDDSQKQE